MEAERGIASCEWGRSAYRAFSSTDERYRERMSCMRKNGYHNGRIVNAGADDRDRGGAKRESDE